MVSLDKTRLHLQNWEAFTENVLLPNTTFSYFWKAEMCQSYLHCHMRSALTFGCQTAFRIILTPSWRPESSRFVHGCAVRLDWWECWRSLLLRKAGMTLNRRWWGSNSGLPGLTTVVLSGHFVSMKLNALNPALVVRQQKRKSEVCSSEGPQTIWSLVGPKELFEFTQQGPEITGSQLDIEC